MSNHDHLFITTPEANLSAGMQFLNGTYASYFNRRHDRVGHLFQGRFVGLIVDTASYGRNLGRYIHLNSCVAGLVEKPEDYRWSSYPGYHRKSQSLSWVSYDLILGEFGADDKQARRAYREFVRAGMDEESFDPFATAVESLILGSDAFVERIQSMLVGRPRDESLPQLAGLRQRPSLDAILMAVATEFGCSVRPWVNGRRGDSTARAVAALLAREFGHTATVTAKALGYAGSSSVTHAVRRIREANDPTDRLKLSRAKLERLVQHFAAEFGADGHQHPISDSQFKL